MELQPQEEKTEETEVQRIDRMLTEQCIKDGVIYAPCEMTKTKETLQKSFARDFPEKYILQKLRAELERRIGNTVNMYVVEQLKSFRDFLNEIEKDLILKSRAGSHLTDEDWRREEERMREKETQPEISNEWAKEAGRDFAKKHLSQAEQKLPEFCWEEVCDTAVFGHKQEIDQNNEMIGKI